MNTNIYYYQHIHCSLKVMFSYNLPIWSKMATLIQKIIGVCYSLPGNIFMSKKRETGKK